MHKKQEGFIVFGQGKDKKKKFHVCNNIFVSNIAKIVTTKDCKLFVQSRI
jgi:hypothetical protein